LFTEYIWGRAIISAHVIVCEMKKACEGFVAKAKQKILLGIHIHRRHDKKYNWPFIII
jgi:hypothetical protein